MFNSTLKMIHVGIVLPRITMSKTFCYHLNVSYLLVELLKLSQNAWTVNLNDSENFRTTRFESVDAVKEKVTRVLKEVIEVDFQHCFEFQEVMLKKAVPWWGKGQRRVFEGSGGSKIRPPSPTLSGKSQPRVYAKDSPSPNKQSTVSNNRRIRWRGCVY